MRKALAAVVVLGSLAAVPATAAGGWATVGLSSLPTGVEPGKAWVVDLRILQHGLTPLAGVRPKVTITNEKTRKRIDYPARPTAEAGVYRAQVRFPVAGEWDYEVDDGFSQVHTFAPVTVGKAAPATPPQTAAAAKGASAVVVSNPDPFPAWLVALGALLALLTAGVARLFGRHLTRARAAAR